VERAERRAEGELNDDELRTVHHDCTHPSGWKTEDFVERAVSGTAEESAWLGAWAVSLFTPNALAMTFMSSGGWSLSNQDLELERRGDTILNAERALHTALLRDIFGPLPFRPVTLDPSVLAWHDGTVVRLARSIYDERRFENLPLLGDALMDAGCDQEEVVAHCRAGGEHFKGCWVVDLCLGRG
jgi:hypothetical protein